VVEDGKRGSRLGHGEILAVIGEPTGKLESHLRGLKGQVEPREAFQSCLELANRLLGPSFGYRNARNCMDRERARMPAIVRPRHSVESRRGLAGASI
jgi:hypothetical protein